MIKRFFGPIPFLIFIVLSAVLVYSILHFLPSTYSIANSKLELAGNNGENKSPNTFKIADANIRKISEKLNLLKNSKKVPSSPIISYLEKNESTSNLFPSDVTLKLLNENKELSLDFTYTPVFYKKEATLLIIDEAKLLLTELLKEQYEAKKHDIKLILQEKEKLPKPAVMPESHEVVEPEKPVVRATVINHKIPEEITNNIAKFKEFKAQEETKLKEIQDQLNALPAPSSTPLVMLTSNLQKSYEMQMTVLNSKKDWLKNTDADQLKKVEAEKAAIYEKLKNENIKLRDDSYYFKGQQDKALREKHTHLLHEEKSKKEVLDAINQLQNGLSSIREPEPTIITKEDAPLINKEQIEAELLKAKSIQKEIEMLNSALKEIDANIENLTNNGLSATIPIETNVKIAYYKNQFIATCLGVMLLTLLLLTGIIFGSSNKVSRAKVVAEILDAPLLGTIPDLPNEGLENAKHKRLTDAIDQITDSLTKIMKEKEIKTLNILSPNSTEGRTQLTGMLTLSFNLKKNMKVIALDTCFNNPKLADFLELKTKLQPNEDGLIGYFKHLMETKEISETDNNQWLAKLVKPCIRNGVFVISPGAGSFTDSNSFNSKVIMTMHEGLGKYVDLIISDTPPLNSNLSFVSKVLAENTIGNIVLIKKGVYKKKELESIKKKLVGVNILGFILK